MCCPSSNLLYRLDPNQPEANLAARVQRFLDSPPAVSDSEFATYLPTYLRPYLWFLERADVDGIRLTGAGYMKPADVLAASALIPRMNDWIGMNNRDSQTVPVLEFRGGLQKIGLLRKNKGRLLRTKLGTTLPKNPAKLADHIASRLLPTGPGVHSVWWTSVKRLDLPLESCCVRMILDRCSRARCAGGVGCTRNRSSG